MRNLEARTEQGTLSENQEYEARVQQIFIRCERLIEQAEFIMPKERHQSDEAILEQYGTLKHPNPTYLFIFPDGRRNHIDGSRTRYIDDFPGIERTEEFWEISYSFNLRLLERFKTGLPKEVVLEMKKREDGLINAELRESSAATMGKLLRGEDILSIKPPFSLIERIAELLSISPNHVTDYMAKDVRSFNQP